METELFKTFLEVEKTRHFGRAAENLYLTQAAVSSRIRQLENLFGVSLFNRYRNNINLTPAGERLKPHALAVVTALSHAMQDAALTEKEGQQIAIGGTPNLWDSLLQEYLHSLYRQYLGIALKTVVQDREALTQQLLSRVLDMAVMFDPPKVDELRVHNIHQMDLVMVSSYADSHFNNVFEHGYIQIDWGSSYNLQHAQIVGQKVVPIMHSSTGRIALDFMLEHGGVAFLPESTVEPYIQSGGLFRVAAAPTVKLEVYMTYLKNSEKLETFEQIVELFSSMTPKSVLTAKSN
ncbi:LysR family transcriptional regulator [Oceanicoccus sp. KOV_DT_Chl]|uniref:LysR family transcriptional regulator n=1 Tax=Oceanicoccus sp. KOV_DT_Chl TaxID=1904639 RepID=UPI000C7E1418|nr:LysR family transcriptional regulator [Oceanicoccus sp. KOV_DT_Chl]